ncbi:MAG: aminoacyl--tRNA ligase-related protein [Acidobacteriota bacterium]
MSQRCTCESALYQVDSGLATFGPEMVRLRDLLEARFLAWAADVTAEVKLYPPLLRVEDLAVLDYFRNFPHLALVASRIRGENLESGYASNQDKLVEVPNEHLTAGGHVLPSAACFNVFLGLRGAVLEAPHKITTVATCFRNETHYNELQRLWSFTMREIVCVGSADAVKEHLTSFKARIAAFAETIGLPIEFANATDPFFSKNDPRLLMQKLFPQKEEMVYGDGIAIGSLNFHRNFFGERCDIRLKDGDHAFTGCVAFGLERWLHALLDRHNDDIEAAIQALSVA